MKTTIILSIIISFTLGVLVDIDFDSYMTACVAIPNPFYEERNTHESGENTVTLQCLSEEEIQIICDIKN